MEKFMEHTNAEDDRHLREQQRLEGQHEVMIYHMGKALYAPVDLSKPGLRILDSGCANGRWLRDLKASSPAQHEYFGTDVDESLYPASPPEGMRFQNQSIKEEFPSEWRDSFDLIHQRFVMAGAAPGTVPPVVEKLAGMLKPAGWMQLIEMNTDPNPDNGPMFEQFIRILRELFATVGVGANFAKDIAGMMEKLGLKDVQSKELFVAHGAKIANENLREKSIASPCSAIAPILQVFSSLPHSFSKEELDGFEGRTRKELEERGAHSRTVVVWGQKESK